MARHRQCSALLLTASLALLGGCGDRAPGSGDTAAGPTLNISGSSTVFPVIEKAIEAYGTTERGRDVRVKLSEVGSTGGLREFCQGNIPIANASRPISSAELKACADNGITFIELPLAFDALTVVVNGGNDWASAISTRELSRTWSKEAEGTIKSWQQINIDWPDRPLRLCGPGDDSGTFDYFNEAINGDKANSRSDYEGSEDDNVIVECVATDANAMGYFGFAYYQANRERLKALAIAGPDGIAVPPSVATAQDGTYKPLSRPLFIYVNDKQCGTTTPSAASWASRWATACASWRRPATSPCQPTPTGWWKPSSTATSSAPPSAAICRSASPSAKPCARALMRPARRAIADQTPAGCSCRGGVGSRLPERKASPTSRQEAHRQACRPPTRNRAPDSRVPSRRPAALAM